MVARRGFVGVGLHCPKFSVNVASALRACGCYGASFLAVSGKRYSKHGADTMRRHRVMPLFQVESLRSVVPYDCVPVAVDLLDGAMPLQEYTHPERAFYVFGPEDGTLGKNVTSWCRDTVYVPSDSCMNLAATVNVVLYDRRAKSLMSDIGGKGAREDAQVQEADPRFVRGA